MSTPVRRVDRPGAPRDPSSRRTNVHLAATVLLAIGPVRLLLDAADAGAFLAGEAALLVGAGLAIVRGAQARWLAALGGSWIRLVVGRMPQKGRSVPMVVHELGRRQRPVR